MARTANEILRDALELPAEERADIATSLLDSLDAEIDADAEASWLAEAERRASELDAGTVKTLPWPDVRSKLRAAIGKER